MVWKTRSLIGENEALVTCRQGFNHLLLWLQSFFIWHWYINPNEKGCEFKFSLSSYASNLVKVDENIIFFYPTIPQKHTILMRWLISASRQQMNISHPTIFCWHPPQLKIVGKINVNFWEKNATWRVLHSLVWKPRQMLNFSEFGNPSYNIW